MLKLPFSGEDHGDPVLVRRGDDLIVPQRSAGLDDRGDSGRGDGVEAVTEREEGVARRRSPGPPRRPLDGDLPGCDPVLLAPADADRHAPGGQHDGVGLDVGAA